MLQRRPRRQSTHALNFFFLFEIVRFCVFHDRREKKKSNCSLFFLFFRTSEISPVRSICPPHTHRSSPSASGRRYLRYASSASVADPFKMAAALLKNGTATTTMGPSSSTATTMALSSPPLFASPSTSPRPSIQCRRGLFDARMSSGNNASSSGIGSCSSGSSSCSSRATSSGLRMRTRAAAGVRLAGSGSSAPAHVLTNDDLSQLVETNDEWIAQRTGIRCVPFFSFPFFYSSSSFVDHQLIERSRLKNEGRNKRRGSNALSCACFPRFFPYFLASMRMVAIVGMERGEFNL